MGILGRLGNVLRSYLSDDVPSPRPSVNFRADPDMESAYAELDDFLKSPPHSFKGEEARREARGEEARRGEARRREARPRAPSGASPVPEDVREAFAALGLEPGASWDACKDAYKRLVKEHHPDRHAGDEAAFRQATETTARLNAAYDRVKRWRGES